MALPDKRMQSCHALHDQHMLQGFCLGADGDAYGNLDFVDMRISLNVIARLPNEPDRRPFP